MRRKFYSCSKLLCGTGGSEVILHLSKMENSVSKCEKTPWTASRRWLSLLMLLLTIGTIILMSYGLNISQSVDLPLLATSSWSSKPNNNTIATSTHSVSAVDNAASQYSVAYPHPYYFIVDEPNRCQQESPFLVLMVPVSPHNREARDVIRSTWGKETTVMGQVVSHYFLLGKPREGDKTELNAEQVLQESQRHHDILQSDFVDSYNNLTIKTMVMFKWLVSHCPNTSYAMKIDSDIFLNVHNLVDMLLKTPQQLYMTGMVARDAPVLRDHNSKWFMPFSDFPESTYPPYALGLGYVFSMDLPQKILEASLHVKALYIEDVYVGLCMKYLGIKVTDPPNSGFRATMPYSTDNCYWTSVITTILQDSNQLKDIWRTYETQAQGGC